MDFLELSQAVSGATRLKDHARFKALVDEFLSAAQGEEYALALCLQADGYLVLDPKNAVNGLVLIDEALPLLMRFPVVRLRALTTALALCMLTSDIDRAHRYEEEAYRLLLEHAGIPEVRAIRHRLQLNLALVAAYVRLDYSTAYWHLAQAANSLTSPDVPEAERRWYESAIQLKTAMACLRVRRYFEAQEALDLAVQSAQSERDRIYAKVLRIDLLRQLGAAQEAQELATAMEDRVATSNHPDVLSEYYWTVALLAQDTGDLVRCHKLLSLARETAIEHHYDFLLATIQRYLRTPLS